MIHSEACQKMLAVKASRQTPTKMLDTVEPTVHSTFLLQYLPSIPSWLEDFDVTMVYSIVSVTGGSVFADKNIFWQGCHKK